MLLMAHRDESGTHRAHEGADRTIRKTFSCRSTSVTISMLIVYCRVNIALDRVPITPKDQICVSNNKMFYTFVLTRDIGRDTAEAWHLTEYRAHTILTDAILAVGDGMTWTQYFALTLTSPS